MTRNYVGWYKLKSAIEQRQAPEFSERDVWWCALGANIGHEEDGKHDNFERPVLVLRKFSKDLFVGVPLTTTKRDTAFYYAVTVAGIDSSVILSHQRTLSSKRLLRKVGRVIGSDFQEITIKVSNLIKKRIPQKRDPRTPSGDLYSNSTKL